MTQQEIFDLLAREDREYYIQQEGKVNMWELKENNKEEQDAFLL